jgi:hypothetical protein
MRRFFGSTGSVSRITVESRALECQAAIVEAAHESDPTPPHVAEGCGKPGFARPKGDPPATLCSRSRPVKISPARASEPLNQRSRSTIYVEAGLLAAAG